MSDHRKRFERWKKKLPKSTRYLVDLVLTRIVPKFEERGFKWYPDYAGGDPMQVGANTIPLQRRDGKEWPTVEITFDKRFRPSFHINFAMLPPICRRLTMDGRYIDIPREKAIVVEAPAYFVLCKGMRKSYDCEFGYECFSFILRKRFLEKEIETLECLLPDLFTLFDQGIPEAWLKYESGYVAGNIIKG